MAGKHLDAEECEKKVAVHIFYLQGLCDPQLFFARECSRRDDKLKRDSICHALLEAWVDCCIHLKVKLASPKSPQIFIE